MLMQGNWICKHTVEFPASVDNTLQEFTIPAGHLKCVLVGFVGSGTARAYFLRIPQAGNLGIYPAGLAGFTDWWTIWAAWNRPVQPIYVDVDSRKSDIEVMFEGSASADGGQIQISFWYQPENPVEDAELSPVGNRSRGGDANVSR